VIETVFSTSRAGFDPSNENWLDLKDKDKNQALKDKDNGLKLVLKESLRTTTGLSYVESGYSRECLGCYSGAL